LREQQLEQLIRKRRRVIRKLGNDCIFVVVGTVDD
jgi:hypothetical protein